VNEPLQLPPEIEAVIEDSRKHPEHRVPYRRRVEEPPPAEDATIQLAVALADTPLGQKTALMITILLGKDTALGVADAIKQAAATMSSSGLIVASQNGTSHDLAKNTS
jgi:hypothetical protein